MHRGCMSFSAQRLRDFRRTVGQGRKKIIYREPNDDGGMEDCLSAFPTEADRRFRGPVMALSVIGFGTVPKSEETYRLGDRFVEA